MDKYYYLVSQLPHLTFLQEPPIKREYFLEEARKWVSLGEFLILSKVDINDFYLDKRDPELLREHKMFEFSLRNQLALFRKSKKEGQAVKLSKELSFLGEANPLEAEIELLRMRWESIEEKEKEHYFDLEFLILYFLKIQILERLATFNKEKGQKVFEKLCEVHT